MGQWRRTRTKCQEAELNSHSYESSDHSVCVVNVTGNGGVSAKQDENYRQSHIFI